MFANARLIFLCSMTNLINGRSIRRHISNLKAAKDFKQSATHRLVHALQVSGATQENMVKLEALVPTPMPMPSSIEGLPPKRTEQDQRRISKAQSMEIMKNVFNHKLPMVARLPFIPMPAVAGKVSSRHFENAEDLLKVNNQPYQLAEKVISLARELSLEKDKNKRLTVGYEELFKSFQGGK